MGSCTSRSRSPATSEMSRVRKSQTSPPILIGLNPEPDCPRSHYSYPDDPPAPPRPLTSITTSPSKTNVAARRPSPCTRQPSSPRKDADANSAASQERKSREQELDNETAQVSIHMEKLLHRIRAYFSLTTQTQAQTLSDLSALLAALPAPPRALLVRGQIQALERDVEGLHAAKERALGKAFEPALASLTDRWGDFLVMGDAAQRAMARRLGKGCVLMRIFDCLSLLRAGCEELLTLDTKIEQRVARDFDAVLAQLREEECAKRGEGGGASMQWMVLGIVGGKRRERLEAKMEAVQWGRGVVSAALLGVVEALGEEMW